MLYEVITGYAVHVLKAVEHHEGMHVDNPGRFWYVMGRDGMMTKVDLWQSPDKMKVSYNFV